jgi:hypothetical protein
MSTLALIKLLAMWFDASLAIAVVWCAVTHRAGARDPVSSENYHCWQYARRLISRNAVTL